MTCPLFGCVGLMLAETEFALQTESDIEPYKGILLGLFFMTVGMNISFFVLISKWRLIFGALIGLLVIKTGIVAAIGPLFGLTRSQAFRSGLLLSAGKGK